MPEQNSGAAQTSQSFQESTQPSEDAVRMILCLLTPAPFGHPGASAWGGPAGLAWPFVVPTLLADAHYCNVHAAARPCRSLPLSTFMFFFKSCERGFVFSCRVCS